MDLKLSPKEPDYMISGPLFTLTYLLKISNLPYTITLPEWGKEVNLQYTYTCVFPNSESSILKYRCYIYIQYMNN